MPQGAARIRDCLLVAVGAVAAATGVNGSGCTMPAGHTSVECLDVPQCPATATASDFTVLVNTMNGSGPTPGTKQGERTTVEVCHHDWLSLELHWKLVGPPVPGAFRPNLTECHAKVWEEDAAEQYFAPLRPGAPFDPTNYTEVDVGPGRHAEWLGHMYNPSGYAPDPASYTTLPECNASGIVRTVANTSTGWTVDLVVPLAFLAPGVDLRAVRQWRANLYRWSGSPRVLSAWSPTSCAGAGTASCNIPHVPHLFGVFNLLEHADDSTA